MMQLELDAVLYVWIEVLGEGRALWGCHARLWGRHEKGVACLLHGHLWRGRFILLWCLWLIVIYGWRSLVERLIILLL